MQKILIIDNSSCIKEHLSRVLGPEGYSVEMNSGNCWESIKLKLISSEPKLVLLELFIDEVDGFELFKKIKQLKPELPVIIYTAYAYSAFQDDPRLSQADGFVTKSTGLKKLKQTMSQVLTQKVVTPAVKSEYFLPTKTKFAEGL